MGGPTGTRPRRVVLARSVRDVVGAIESARSTGEHLVPRGGGHCFAGRSSMGGIVVDLSALDSVSVAADGIARIGAGIRLGPLYRALHGHGRTLPAGCGATVGITGLTLGGGIGLLGRKYGLTCDRLIGAQVVLADGSVVTCDQDQEPDLFWALRGAGGGQFGVVTALRFDTVPEPVTTRIEVRWPAEALEELVHAWQAWAPDVPDALTVNLAVVSEPGLPARATLFGASTFAEGPTWDVLRELTDQVSTLPATIEVRGGLLFHRLKRSFSDQAERVVRSRSEFFRQELPDRLVTDLLAQLSEPRSTGRRELAFTAMGGAYNLVAENATAFAHRSERFLLEHIAETGDPWIDASWATAHPEGSGRVYPNFPDPALEDSAAAYHAGNQARLVAVKNAYDPQQFFHFPQAIRSTSEGKP